MKTRIKGCLCYFFPILIIQAGFICLSIFLIRSYLKESSLPHKNKMLKQMTNSIGSRIVQEIAIGTPECGENFEPLLKNLHSEFLTKYCECPSNITIYIIKFFMKFSQSYFS